jgi:hypothetical protein
MQELFVPESRFPIRCAAYPISALLYGIDPRVGKSGFLGRGMSIGQGCSRNVAMTVEVVVTSGIRTPTIIFLSSVHYV